LQQRTFLISILIAILQLVFMGTIANYVGDARDVSPDFFRGWNILNDMFPSNFFFRFCIWRGFKNCRV